MQVHLCVSWLSVCCVALYWKHRTQIKGERKKKKLRRRLSTTHSPLIKENEPLCPSSLSVLFYAQ
jgi:hypothetical protein